MGRYAIHPVQAITVIVSFKCVVCYRSRVSMPVKGDNEDIDSDAISLVSD